MPSRYSRLDYFKGLAVMAVFAVVLYLLLPARWTGPWKYARQFHVSTSSVHWKEKPADCDYFRSPMGDKGCHFKIALAAYNADGEIVGGDDAPLFRDDPDTRQSLVSYDDGVSWHPRGRLTSNAVTRVVVRWKKVDD